MNAWAIKGPDGTLSLPLKESDAWIGYDDTDIEYLKAQGFTCVPVTVTEIVERSPYEVMAEGNHSIGVFKDGKLIAADAARDAAALPRGPARDAAWAAWAAAWAARDAAGAARDAARAAAWAAQTEEFLRTLSER